MLNRRFSIVLFSALLLAVVILGLPNLFPIPRVAAINRTITLVGLVSGWNFTSTPNPTITVIQGDIVTINLSSGDTLHQFALDVDKDGAKFTGSCSTGDTCSNQFTPSTPTSVVINTSSLLGTYTYFCTIHSSMVGSFVVNPSTSVGGTEVPIDRLALVAPYLGLASALAILVAITAYMIRNRRKEKKKVVSSGSLQDGLTSPTGFE